MIGGRTAIANFLARRAETAVSFIAAMLFMQAVGETGPTPHNARNRKGGARRIARTSAAMEAAMTRRLDAFATPGVHLAVGADDLIPPHNTDAPLKSL
jgi:hypothetical protein